MKYNLLKDLTPKESKEKQRVGLYLDNNGNKIVIKKHSFVFIDEDYRRLLNEASAMRLLNEINSSDKIIVPRLLNVTKKGNFVEIVSEYESGEMIFEEDEKSKIYILKECIVFLSEISKDIAKKNLKLMKKNSLFLIMTFPYYLTKAMIKYPKEWRFNMKMALSFYSNYIQSNPFRQDLVLAHCELYQDSILYDKKTGKIKLVDWESAVLADKFYDLSLVCRFYFKDLSTGSIKDLISSYVKNKVDYRRFLSIGIFGNFESLSSRSFNINYLLETKQYLQFINSI